MDSELNLIGPRLRQLREHRELTVAASPSAPAAAPK